MLNAKVARSDMTVAAWFGDSWTWGTELEKCLGTGYDPVSRNHYREHQRFSFLVSDHFGWQEQNHATPGISAERLVLDVIAYVERVDDHDKKDLRILVMWPSYTRYFWTDEHYKWQDIRISDEWREWYAAVDNYSFQIYNARRSIWMLQTFLELHGIRYYFANSVYALTEPEFYRLDPEPWLLGEDHRLSDLLEFNVDRGYPKLSDQHPLLWPCESHPNQQGHQVLADVLIDQIKKKEASCQF